MNHLRILAFTNIDSALIVVTDGGHANFALVSHVTEHT